MTNSIARARSVLEDVQAAQLPFLAAAIAYYAFLSLLPLVIVSVAVTSVVAGDSMAETVARRAGTILTPDATTVLEDAIRSGAGRESMTLVGLVVLVWSSLRLFRGLDIAFDRVYGVMRPKPLPAQLRDALVAVLGIGAAVAVTGFVTAIIPTEMLPFSSLVATVVLFLTLSAVFFPLFYLLPDRAVSARQALPGALFVGVGWTVLGTAFGMYTAQATTFQLYGILAGVLLLLLWFYFGGLLILVGAFLNAELAGHVRDRQLQQAPRRETNQRPTMTAAGAPEDDPGENADAEADGKRSGDETTDTARIPRADSVTQEEIDELRRELDQLEESIEDRTVHREELERDLKGYVRSRVRRGHARGWGPYLVLLYGTAMTLGAFYFLGGGWAILAMLVIWLSTLGLYTLMVVVGLLSTTIGLPGRILDRLRNLR